MEMEWEVVLDWGGRLDRLDFESGADVGQSTGSEWKRLWVVCLPSLILGTKIKRPRVLKIWWKDDGLISCFPRQLHPQVPRVECDKGKLEVFGG